MPATLLKAHKWWSGPGVSQEASVMQNASNNNGIECWIYRESSCWLLKPCQTTPNMPDWLYYLQDHHKCPLPQGNTLVTYENSKLEKNCEGIEIGYESMSEINIDWSGDCKTRETGISCSQQHWIVTVVNSDGDAGGSMTGCKCGKISTDKSEVVATGHSDNQLCWPNSMWVLNCFENTNGSGSCSIGAVCKYVFTG